MKQRINIPRTLANQLLKLAQSSPESSICGIIADNTDQQYWVYPIESNENSTLCALEIKSQQQLTTLDQIKEKQQSLFAVFHSHPDHPACSEPLSNTSATSLLSTATEDALSLIISLSTQGVLEMHGFSHKNNKAETIDLIIH